MQGADAGLEDGHATDTPAWAVFGDLMSGVLGAFVLLLVLVLGLQLEMADQLQAEVAKRQAEEQRREALERALAAPLAAGRVTLDQGRIGISGSVLFSLGSARLQPAGRQLLDSLAPPLAAYLGTRDELLMVSGFTDDRPVRDSSRQFEDNLELSAQRALTVTRALIDAGLPASTVFAAAFGPQQPVASNADAAGRARNRRVEMAPVPRSASPANLRQAPGPARPAHAAEANAIGPR